MKIAVSILSLLLIAAIAGVVVLKLQEQKKADKAEIIAQELEAKTEQAQKAAKLESEAEEAKVEAEKKAQEALESAEKSAEATRMAQAALAKQEAEKQAKLKELNERLAREAKARQDAEAAAKQAEAKLDQLRKDLETTQQKQLEIAQRLAQKSESEAPRHEALLAQIEKQKAELTAISEQHNKAQEERRRRIVRQVKIEEEIMEAGGTITIPNYRIWSPNYRPSKARSKSVSAEN